MLDVGDGSVDINVGALGVAVGTLKVGAGSFGVGVGSLGVNTGVLDDKLTMEQLLITAQAANRMSRILRVAVGS